MPAAVIDLQREAMDRQVPLSDLLRKAYVIARKLGLDEFETWITKELNGYEDREEVPPYRIVTGQVRGWNPYRGWIPVIWESASEEQWASRRGVAQSVAELEELRSRSPKSQLHMPLPHRVQRNLSASAGFETDFSMFVQHTAIVRIIDAVRNALLNWAIKLEEDGILGEGLTFTHEEKAAATGASYNVNNFFGAVGRATVEQVGRDAVRVSTRLDLDALRALLAELQRAGVDLPEEQQRELDAEVATLGAQLDSPKPKAGVLREAAESIKRILEGSAGDVGGHLALELGRLLLGIG